MASKGYVVRGTKGTRDVYAYGPGMGFGDACEEIDAHAFERLDAAAGARDHMVRLGCEATIFRVHDDGHEERLPSYEEALGEIGRVAGLDQANREAHQAIAKLKRDLEDESRRFHEARTDADVAAGLLAEANKEIERLREVLGCKAEEETHVVAERLLTEIERCVDALKGAVGPTPADPLAALEAAERRLLEAGGWTEEGPDKWSLEGVTWDRRDAVGIARYHAAKGGA